MKALELEPQVVNGRNLFGPVYGEEYFENTLALQMIESEELFEALKPHWRELAERTKATVFMSHDWAWTWWNNFGKHKRRSLQILTFWEKDKLVGLAPFYKGYSSIGGMKIEQRLQLIGSGGSPNEQLGYMDDYGISDFLDILVDRSYVEKVTDLLGKIIKSNSLDVDTISFHQARDDSYIMKHLRPKLQDIRLNVHLEHTDTCPYIPVKGEESLKGFIKKKRSSVRRRFRQSIRAFEQEGDLSLEELKTWPEVERATETMIELHQSRWNRLGFPGVFHDDRFTNFFRETVRYAFDNGWLWFKEIKDEEGVCAGRMLLHYNNRYYDYISGFDEQRESSRYRPGIGLLLEAVRDSINDGSDTVELLRGEEGYKYDFTKNNFRNWRMTIDLPRKSKRLKNSLRKITKLLALAYKRTTREARLVKVQRDQNGVMAMLPGYVSFRWKSFKMKMDD